MRQRWFVLAVSLMALSLVAGLCAPAPTQAPAPTEPAAAAPTEAPTQPPAAEEKFLVGQVTDVGGIDDRSFNASAWAGVQRAIDELGVNGKFLESQQPTDYEANIQEFLEQNADLIITVGFLLGDATKAAAEANADAKFAIVDFAYDPPVPNIQGIVFATDEAAFLAGYVAAGTTQTGKVGTFGGIPIPPVTIFMDGFLAGVQYYNQANGTDVQVLGWDGKDGLFTQNFESLDDGRRFAESLLEEGADIIMPVAGPVGLGSAAAVQDHGDAWLIGVDTDWYVSAPEFKESYLTSVMKRIDNAVFQVTEDAVKGNFQGGGLFVGTLENEGVGIAPFHDNEAAVSQAVKDALPGLRQQIIAGTLSVKPGEAAAAPAKPGEGFFVGQVTDVGGIDDRSFNASAWAGVQRAIDELGVEGKFLESQQPTDYEANIQEFLDQDADLIITVGFLLGDATKAAAEANADAKFAIVDFAYDPAVPNIQGIVFNTDEAAFLAGYVAAGATQTGKVGVFGGIPIPPVTIFMDGFLAGVRYYNQENGTNVQVLGWDGTDGLFTNNFESLDDGRRMAESLMDEGADIVMPVAGPVGLGSAAAIQDRGGAWLIGVDTDWYVSAPPEYQPIYLTSVMKRIDNAVFQVTEDAVSGTFQGGGLFVGTLENEGVGIAPFHDNEDAVPQAVKDALDGLRQGIIDGSISVSPAEYE